jgi:signal transduction histidine kinase
VAGWFVRPLGRITASIENVTEGYESEWLHVGTFSETGQLSDAFNKMLGRLKQLNDSREEFVSNVSHELKTPLTSVKVLADSLLAQENVPIELYQEFMGDIAKEIDRENDIISDLLTLVKMDKTVQGLNIRQININELLETILKRLKPIADKKKIEVVLESFRPVSAEIDEMKLTLAISNLVENAIKYNRPSGSVTVSIHSAESAVLEVTDTGIGISPENQEKIFDPFYRVDKSRSRAMGGAGLGLALVSEIARQHNGQVKVTQSSEKGFSFLLYA